MAQDNATQGILPDIEERLAAFGWYQASNIPSTEHHRNELLRSINVAFGLNADRNLIWANDDCYLWLFTCNGSFYVTNLDHEFVALVADDWSTTLDNLLQEAHAYDGPVRMTGKAYDRTAADESDLLEEWYEKNALGGGI
ncbi:uncharacterized protein H6S33_010335 [Morchella sextelata]|jgi:hypothetical protein|uniref:uncharacterized protein n=1 Tax=Morchella sextelata TaxID=1174677 RepID=UPI001D0402FA|nr:uncharacterized protein H6S33_010335 [Morchella sextelata]KAH0612283.1 hypothetical protein H6S33_010335 [Morchella sextelata]